ncbi:MAG TPA: M28 family peptidase [Thermoanaerobaculia bacterium]|jgi:hypothetical protein|nr:M28 family peptidase [Thermoanaerobaculia bacterium]
MKPSCAALAVSALLAVPAVPAAFAAVTAAPAPAASAAAAAEARAIVSELVACGTRNSLSSWTDPKRGIGCGRDVVVKRFGEIAAKSSGRLKVIVDKYETSGPRTGNAKVPMENVYAVLEGTDPLRRKTAYVVSGHMDSRASDVMDAKSDAPGADDDGSGVAASILSAAALSSRPGGFRATLVFAAVAGEEQGLLGARRLKEWLGQQGYQVGGMITDDIVGATNGAKDRRPRVFSEGGPDGVDSPGREMARRLEEIVGRERVRLVFRRDRFGRGGDHLPFVEAGLPAIRFTEPLEVYDHQHQDVREDKGVQYGDLIRFMDFPFLAEVAALNQAILAELAAAPAPPKSAVLGGAVTPAAKIRIDAEPDPDRKGFEILQRETTETRWKVLRAVGEPGQVVLDDTSTDNEFFAVRSVGKDGHKSLAVPCVPAPAPPPGSVPARPPGR